MERTERIVPRELWLYDDRCMMNWMGWLLADHSAYLEQEAVSGAPRAALVKMTAAAIEACLQQAWTQEQAVAIQMEALYGAPYLPDIEGQVLGTDVGRVFLQQADGRVQTVTVADIRHVRLIARPHWWAA